MPSLEKLRVLMFFLSVIMLSACSTGQFSQPVVVHTTPTPVLAGGEPVLAHSQIHFHDAPAPTPADLGFEWGDWTLAGHDGAGTRTVALPLCCNTRAAAPLWFRSLGTPLLGAPVVANEHIFLLASDGYLHVLSAQDGSEQWRLAVGGELTSSGLALAHGLAYLAVAGHYIAALDASDGHERWRFDTVGAVRAAPLVVVGVLL